jgi:hypothetical protein
MIGTFMILSAVDLFQHFKLFSLDNLSRLLLILLGLF